MPVSQYYLSKDTYQGVHFEIKEEVREEFDVFRPSARRMYGS